MERLEVEMFKNLKISKILIVILVVLCFGWISCTPTTADTTELFKEINRLERELELKETEIESLKNELEITKIQLEEALELKEETVEEEKKSEEPPTPESFSCGEQIMLSDARSNKPFCSLIIHSIENFTNYDQKYGAPDPGMRYLAIDIEVTNLSSSVQSYNYWNYYFRDANKYKYDNHYGDDKEPALDVGDLSPGDIARGWATIQVPVDIEMIELCAEPLNAAPPVIILVDDPEF